MIVPSPLRFCANLLIEFAAFDTPCEFTAAMLDKPFEILVKSACVTVLFLNPAIAPVRRDTPFARFVSPFVPLKFKAFDSLPNVPIRLFWLLSAVLASADIFNCKESISVAIIHLLLFEVSDQFPNYWPEYKNTPEIDPGL